MSTVSRTYPIMAMGAAISTPGVFLIAWYWAMVMPPKIPER
jgi:hypothetical protein